MRADRLLSILMFLNVRRRATAGELAQRLEVSVRTIHRDMEALCIAGVPLHSRRGAGGGWFLPDGYRTNLTGLHAAEVRALFLGRQPKLLRELGFEGADDAAFAKLLSALPSDQRLDAERARERVHVDPGGWRRARDAVPYLPALLAAVWAELRVVVRYERTDGMSVVRRAEPLGLVLQGAAWYLVSRVEGEMRTYRVSRVVEVAGTGEGFERPDGFELGAYWEESRRAFREALPRYPIRVRVAADRLAAARRGAAFVRVEREGPPGPDGARVLDVLAETQDEACAYVLGLGTDAEVLEPPELRRKVGETAAEIASAYRAGVSRYAAEHAEGIQMGDRTIELT